MDDQTNLIEDLTDIPHLPHSTPICLTLLIRVFMNLYCIVMLGFQIYYLKIRGFAFLTNWGAMLTTIYYIFSLIHRFRKHKRFDRFLTALHQLTASVQFLVCLFYWTALAPEHFGRIAKEEDDFTRNYNYIGTFTRHLIFPIMAWVPILMEITHFTKMNGVLTIVFCGLYTICNFTVTKMSGKPVYPVLTYDDVMSWVYIFGCLLILIIGHVLSYLSSAAVRKWMKRKFQERLEKMDLREPLSSMNLDDEYKTQNNNNESFQESLK